MSPRPQATVFVTTFEMPDHLDLVLAGLERQVHASDRFFEVIICDDGSGQETANLVHGFQKRVGFRVIHLWQANQGFRKCRILNQAVQAATGEVFIFLDGDCVPHRNYVSDHLTHQEYGYYLAGRRVELGVRISAWLTPDRVRNGFFDRPRLKLISSAVFGDTKNIQRSVRVPWNSVRHILKMKSVVDLKGCNYSVPRNVLEEINGFDESYEGYGREDTDLEIRLQNKGLTIKSMKGLAIQYHVWHPRREFTPANEMRLEDLRKTQRTEALRGLRESVSIAKL